MRKAFLAVLLLCAATVGAQDYIRYHPPAGISQLTSSGTAITSTVPILLPDGTASVPSLAFATDADGSGTGFYRDATNSITVSANGTAAARWNNTLGYVSYTHSILNTYPVAFLTGSVISSPGSADAFIVRDGSASVQLGQDVNGAAVAQTFKAHDGITGTDVAGANLTIAGGRGTGAGTPGYLSLQTSTALGTGTTAQTLAERVRIQGPSIQASSSKALTDATETAFVRIAIPQTAGSNYAGGEVIYTIFCKDSTNQATVSGTVVFACHNLAGTEACSFGTPTVIALGDGTAAIGSHTFDATSGATDTIDLRVDSDCTGVTPTTHTIQYRLNMPQPNTVTPQ